MNETHPGRILITGAARRLGAELALAAAEDGMQVILHCNQSRDAAEGLAEKITAAGGQAEILSADLADAAACEQLMEAAFAGGPLTGLINNASLFRYDRADDFTAAGLAAHIAVNLTAPAILTAQMARRLPETARACVINMLDAKLFGMNPDYFTYTLSKAALQAMGQMTAQNFAPKLRVNAIAPGITLPSGGQTQEEFEEAHKHNLLGEGAKTAEIVAAMRLILTSPSMTGHVIVLDGGAHLSPPARDVAFLATKSS
jgi:NAD(P)-dependent dehydrogenase (short-subunit alcohol dehydrogenase family)